MSSVFKVFIILVGMILLNSCKQEKLIFFPEKLPADYEFSFPGKFKELNIAVDEKTKINSLLFEADSSKGVVFYLHGNAGSLRTWGEIADVYLSNHYDFFIMDYRGFGKSEGEIKSQKQLFNDIQVVYDSIKSKYSEDNMVVVGYSIGTGPATYLASTNHPKQLMLKAPYYNFPFLVHEHMSWIPSFIIRYKFRTDKYIQQVKCPVCVFHGDEDEVINIVSSNKLQDLFKSQDRLVVLKGQMHNGINSNEIYQRELKVLLGN